MCWVPNRAKRGYNVTGVDLSPSQIKRAREKAQAAGLDIRLERMDARNMPFHEEFDLVIMLCEGGFPLMETDEMNFHDKTTDTGGATYENSRFDIMTFRDHNITYLEDDDGNKKSFECNERYYIPPEITWLLKTLGFNKIDIFGARLGEFCREQGNQAIIKLVLYGLIYYICTYK